MDATKASKEELLIGDKNPFTEAQQAQLRAQIIVYGSILRDQVPQEALMSLCFADISQGSTIEDFHEGNLRRGTWEKIWQACSKKVRVKPPGKPIKAPKSAVPAAPTAPTGGSNGKRKAAAAAAATNLDQPKSKKPNPGKQQQQQKIKERNISELQEPQREAEDADDPGNEPSELVQLAATAIKAMSGHFQHEREAYWKTRQDVRTADANDELQNTSKGPGDLTEDKAESAETDDAETSKEPDVEADKELKAYSKRSPKQQLVSELMPDEFVEGASVEVVSDDDGLHGVWFSGKIIAVRGGKVQVEYDELLEDGGEAKLAEWIPVYDATRAEPRVRLAHPVTPADLPLKNAKFTLGDHVDVWMNDGWWEGIIEGINSDNKKEVTLFFPGEGDVGMVKLSNLRPSLVWKDGKWVAWSRDPPKKPVKKKKPVVQPNVEPTVVEKKPEPLVLDGKRKRERPKRLEDGLDDNLPPRKPYTRKVQTSAAGKTDAKASSKKNTSKKMSTTTNVKKAKKK